VIDIHSHVVWAVDDGPTSLEESLAMLQASAADGVTDIVATSHSNQRYAYDAELVQGRIAELGRCTAHPRIHRGCEFHLTFDNVDQLLENHTAFTINGTRYLLLECPDFHIGRHTEAVLQRLIDVALVPIVAHPERNPQLQKALNRLESWIELGCLAQVTSLSITGGFGGPPRSAAMKIIERGLAHMVASDAHDSKHRHPRLSAAYAVVRRSFDEDTADLLFTHNPNCVIQGLPVARGMLAAATPGRRWWPF